MSETTTTDLKALFFAAKAAAERFDAAVKAEAEKNGMDPRELARLVQSSAMHELLQGDRAA